MRQDFLFNLGAIFIRKHFLFELEQILFAIEHFEKQQQQHGVEKSMKEKKLKCLGFWDPYFLIRYTLGDHKNAHMKIFHVYSSKKFWFFWFIY